MKSHHRRSATLAASLFSAMALAVSQASSQDAFPTSSVRILVPTAAGGTTDAATRIVADVLASVWRRSVLIENVAGGGGNIGGEMFSRQPADGHVLLSAPPNALAINQFLYRKINYEPRSFEPITILGTSPNVLITSPKLGVRSVAELVKKARENPGKLSYATQGAGSTGHLTAAWFETLAGIKLNHVPYRGTAPALNDLIGGHVDFMFDNIASSLPPHRSNALRIIAVCSADRLAALPEIPTIVESGFPGFLSVSWFAMAAPPRTPRAIVIKINQDVVAALKTQAVREKFTTLGLDPMGNTPAAAAAFLEEERARWSQVIAKANLRVE
jgi:tripartite-type tricarboxylate transporter receptor subunit TctC